MPDELSMLIQDFIRPNNRKTHEKKWRGVMGEYHEHAEEARSVWGEMMGEDGYETFSKVMVAAIWVAMEREDDEE